MTASGSVGDQLKQPKRIDPVEAAAPLAGGAAGGSAWNSAGTWEEKDLSKWAQDALTAQLKGLQASAAPTAAEMQALVTQQLASLTDSVAAAEAGSMASLTDSAAATELEEAMAPLLLKVTDVKKCEGAASVQSSRGKVKHIYDLQFDIEWEASLQPLDAAAAAAVATVGADATPKKPSVKCKGSLSYAEVSSAAASVGDFEVTSKYKKAPGAKLKARADAGVALLRLEVLKAVEAFAAELKAKSL